MTNSELIDELKKRLKENIPLMEKPEDLTWRNRIFTGCEIHTCEPRYSDPTYWYYPEGVEDKVNNNKHYRVWYTWKDTADPTDTTTWYYVKYIEEIPEENIKFIEELKKIVKDLLII